MDLGATLDNPQSFGANAPLTGGYNKSDLLTEGLSRLILNALSDRSDKSRMLPEVPFSYELEKELA